MDGISSEFFIYKGYKIDDIKIKAPINNLTLNTAFVAAALTLGIVEGGEAVGKMASAGHHVNSGGTRPYCGLSFLSVGRKTFLPK